jgi:GNAT superfamily N-acetyltransferase
MANATLAWRGDLERAELNRLFRDAWGPERSDESTAVDRVKRHSLGWVTARDRNGVLVGFVNVAWDGGEHATLLDTTVAPAAQRSGLGTRLVQEASAQALAAGCRHVHVDFEPHLGDFYLGACGFRPTDAGLISS